MSEIDPPQGTNATGIAGVSTVTNSDGSLTVSPTAGNVVVSLTLSKLNIWTAPIGFNGTYVPSSSTVGIGSDSSSDFILNTATGGQIQFWTQGTEKWFIGFGGNIEPKTDNTYFIGSSTTRVQSINGGTFNSYATPGDTYPAAQLNLNSLQFGPGGSSLADISLFRESAQILAVRTLTPNAATLFDVLPNGSSTTSVLRVWSADEQTQSALEALNIRSDTFSGAWEIGSRETGGGALRALVFASGGIEAFRVQTASPYFKFNESTTGTTTALLGTTNSPATVGTAPYVWIKVAAPDTTTVWIPAWK